MADEESSRPTQHEHSFQKCPDDSLSAPTSVAHPKLADDSGTASQLPILEADFVKDREIMQSITLEDFSGM